MPLCICTLVALVCLGMLAPLSGSAQSTTPAAKTPIKHLVSVMQSNRSFDHYFGAYPGVTGIPTDVCMPEDPLGETSDECIAPFRLETYEEDLSHTHLMFEQQYRNGEMDGFIDAFRQRGELQNLTMGYLDDLQLPFHWNVAEEYVLFDRYFSSASAGSTPNRMFWVSGTAGVTDLDRVGVPDAGWGELPTIFDRLEEQGIPWKFYIENYDPSVTYRNRGEGGINAQFAWAPLLSFARFLDNPELSSHIVDLDEYFVDLQRGTLPAVSYVVTVGSSEHPPSNPLSGQKLLRRMVTALMQSSAWESSALTWAHDDWGGWYDHVTPPEADEFGYGFRVPSLLVSPYARRGYVDNTVLDHTSVLRFIEDNYGLAPLAERDAAANSIVGAFDFSQPPREPAIISMSRTPTPSLIIPDRSTIYLVYASGSAFAAMLIGLTLAWSVRARRRPAIPPVRLRPGGARSS